MFAGRKKHLTPPETAKAVRALGVACTTEEILMLGLPLSRVLPCRCGAVGGQQQVGLKAFLDIAARVIHAHPDKDEDEAIAEAFRCACHLPARADARSVFDRQGSGYIPAREFATFCKILGEPFSDAESTSRPRSPRHPHHHIRTESVHSAMPARLMGAVKFLLTFANKDGQLPYEGFAFPARAFRHMRRSGQEDAIQDAPDARGAQVGHDLSRVRRLPRLDVDAGERRGAQQGQLLVSAPQQHLDPPNVRPRHVLLLPELCPHELAQRRPRRLPPSQCQTCKFARRQPRAWPRLRADTACTATAPPAGSRSDAPPSAYNQRVLRLGLNGVQSTLKIPTS